MIVQRREGPPTGTQAFDSGQKVSPWPAASAQPLTADITGAAGTSALGQKAT